jgi:hypothetical protein
LRDQVAELQEKLKSKEATPETKPVAGKAAEILASLKEDVNEDVADRIMQLAGVLADERVEARIGDVAGKVETLQQTAVERAQTVYMKELDRLVPDWREISAEPDYSAFLQEKDDMSGKTLYDLASGAVDRLDAEHMAVFFRKYKEKKGLLAPKGTPEAGGEKPAGKKSEGKDALVSPRGAAKTTPREGGAEKPDFITTRQMEQFNKDRRIPGKYTAKEEARMQARIDRAIAKRWIVP